MTYDILATGSTGNAVVINGEILIDCGVSMKLLRQSGYIKDLKLVLLTHGHADHFNRHTVEALCKERPSLKWGCCEWMWPHLAKAGIPCNAIHLYIPDDKTGYRYSNQTLYIIAVPLWHDVPNCGYRIFHKGESLFYATDTGTLDGIEAKNYDYYLIEANHTQADIASRIEDKLSRGEFAYEYRAAQYHLSYEQAMEWRAQNAGPNSRCELLHQHKETPKEKIRVT